MKQMLNKSCSVFLTVVFSLSITLAQKGDQAEVQLKAAIQKQTVDGDLKGAIEQYKKIAQSPNRVVAARALIRMGECYEKMGDAEARKAYERVIREFADQRDIVNDARTHLAALMVPARTDIAIRRLWAGPKTAMAGMSADGRYVLYDFFENSGNLAVRDLNTGKARKLTNKGDWERSTEYAGQARFSPDGKTIAFAWNSKKEYQLHLVDLDGSNEKTIYTNPEIQWIGPVDFSRDGKEILVKLQTRNQTAQIAWIPVAGGQPRVLKSLPWSQMGKVGLSPDGRFIAYDAHTTTGSGERSLFVLTSDASHETTVFDGTSGESFVGWMPDGKWILFSGTHTGIQDLSAIPVSDGRTAGAPIVVKSDVGPSQSLGITNKGVLLYQRFITRGEAYVASVDWNTGQFSKITSMAQNVVADFGPDFSPDGKHVAFVAHRGNDIESRFIVVRNLETGEQREVIPKPHVRIVVLGGYRWSPDGKSFLVPGADDKHRASLFSIDLASGETRFLFERPGGQIQSAEWMDGGKSILYRLVEYPQPKALLFIRDLGTMTDREFRLGTEDAEHITMSLSPDKSMLAFSPIYVKAGSPESISIAPMAGGSSRTIVESAHHAWIYGWTPDGQRIIYRTVQGEDKDSATLWWIPSEGGEAHKLSLPNLPNVRDVRFHQDGHRVGYTTNEVDSELWSVENVLSLITNHRATNAKD